MTSVEAVTFRVDASADIGIGHLRRCIALADELRRREIGARFVFAKHFSTELENPLVSYPLHWLQDHVSGSGSRIDDDNELGDADATLAAIGKSERDRPWVVLDSYRLGHLWEQRVSNAGYRILVIDDFRTRMHHADLLVSDSEQPFKADLNERAATARMLVGPRYALLDRAYAYTEPSTEGGMPRRLLISYGSADGTGETEKALKMIRTLQSYQRLRGLIGRTDVVIGLENRRGADIEQAAEGVPNVVFHRAVMNLAPILRKVDLFFTAGGQSMVEALALRKPCIVTVTADNQDLMVGELAAKGIIRSAGHYSTLTEQILIDLVTNVLNNIQSFSSQVAAFSPFDHLGVQRVADVMMAAGEASGQAPSQLGISG